MLLLGIDSLLLLLITLSLGLLTIAAINKLFRCFAEANVLGIFLAGLITSTCYFNVISFWLPVNYYSLLPLLILACITIFTNKERCKQLLLDIQHKLAFIFAPQNLILTIPLLAVLFYYWIIPPINSDSADYHYTTIALYEKYRVIPGLANIHGRYGFNPAAFIVQAAYSFTGLTGQAIYPLNGVLTALFTLWLLVRIIQSRFTGTGIVYFLLLIVLSRILFTNISSPTPDTLFVICLCYAFIKIYDSLYIRHFSIASLILPALLLIYAVTAKLATLPTLLLLPFLLFCIRKQPKLLSAVIKFTLASILICLPWLCRNIILSGYLVYPAYKPDLFTVDWKTRKDVLVLEYAYIKALSAIFSQSYTYVRSLPFYQYFLQWFMVQLKTANSLNFVFFTLALLSPLYWLAALRKKGAIQPFTFILWLIVYLDIWFWLYGSPEYRFGITFLAFAITLPWLAIRHAVFTRIIKPLGIVVTVGMLALSVIYLSIGFNKPSNYAFSIKDYWLYPLKDKEYFTNNDTATFTYKQLSNGVKIYIPDKQHTCLNAPQLPCAVWPYGAVIEARGPRIEDGFRMISDSILQMYPTIK